MAATSLGETFVSRPVRAHTSKPSGQQEAVLRVNETGNRAQNKEAHGCKLVGFSPAVPP